MKKTYRIKNSLLHRTFFRFTERGFPTLIAGLLLLSLVVAVIAAARFNIIPYDPYSNNLDRSHTPPDSKFINNIFSLFFYNRESPVKKQRNATQEDFFSLDDQTDLKLNPKAENSKNSTQPVYPLGSDINGRDILSRIAAGADAYILPGLLSVSIALLFGLFLGSSAGYFGGFVEKTVFYLIQVIRSFPRLILILLVAALFKPDIYLVMAALGFLNIPRTAEVIYARIRKFKESGFVEAVKSIGAGHSRIILKHLLISNSKRQILSAVILGYADAILIETALSYLGFGVQEPFPSWGNLTVEGGPYFFEGVYWVAAFPALFIIISLSALFLLGDGLNKYFEPRK